MSTPHKALHRVPGPLLTALTVPLCAAGLGLIASRRFEAAARVVEPAAAPQRALVVVLGAPAPGGVATRTLSTRLQAAAALAARFVGARLLVSGTPHETAVMRAALEALCMRAVEVDDGAFRTLHSLERLRAAHAPPLLLVSNAWHLPRALALARGCGLDAIGVRPSVDALPRRRDRLREHAASARAALEIALGPAVAPTVRGG